MATPLDPPPPNASSTPDERRAWLVLGGGLALVALVGIAALTFGQGDRAGSGCVTGLVDHLPADVDVVQGSNLAGARDAGYDDGGDHEQWAKSVFETAVMPDPLSNRSLQNFVEPSESAGYEPADVECWLGPIEQTFVARGSFDGGRLDRSEWSESGSFELDGGLLAFGSDGEPGEMLATRDQPDALRGLVEAFDRHGAVSFSGVTAGGEGSEPWSGLALTRGDDWELLVVWSFPDAGAAGDGEAVIVAALGDGSKLGELIEGDPAEQLERDGSTVTLRAALTGEPRTWIDPFRYLDPALMALSDFPD